MKRSATATADVPFEMYEQWRAAGAPFPAICALGEFLRAAAGAERDLFIAELKKRVDPSTLAGAAGEATTCWRRIMRIVSVGAKFNEDEILLMLTLRQEIELVVGTLTVFGIGTREIDLMRVDTELREIAHSKENKRAFGKALASIRRNADPAFEDKWSA